MNIDAPAFTQVLTANGDTDGVGYARVADTSGYFIGAYAYINQGATSNRCVITEIKSPTIIGLRFINDDIGPQSFPAYGSRSSLATYTTAAGARINMPAQVVRILPSYQRVAGTV